jgi:uncharacterized membrane protein
MSEAGASKPKRVTPMHVCQFCGEKRPARQTVPASLLRPSLEDYIRSRKPDWSSDGYICQPCLNRLRNDFVRKELEDESGELSALEEEVMKAIHDNESVVENLNREFDAKLTLGERIADHVASVGGSWGFVIGFGVFLVIWVIINTVVLLSRAFDPYPFILLNLFLSMLAAIQAPIIMMSQNRAAARDRLQAENDFKVNLRAELEVRAIGEKMDQLLHHQWARLLEIQQIQMEMLENLSDKHGR